MTKKNDINSLLLDNLDKLKNENLYRKYPLVNIIEPPCGNYFDEQQNAIKVTIWGSNNYLGLANNEHIKDIYQRNIGEFGIGSGGTRNILGTSPQLSELEKKIANWYNKGSALIFGSALTANIGAIQALGKIFDKVCFFSDQDNHASIIDGIKLSGCNKIIFEHNNIDDLSKKLAERQNHCQKNSINELFCIIVESLYSMDGSSPDFTRLVELKKQYNCLLFVDEVHAVGLYGKNGSGKLEESGLEQKVDIISGTFAKALGAKGGYITASEILTENIRHYAGSFIFTTAISASEAATLSYIVDYVALDEGYKLRKKQQEMVALTKKAFHEVGLDFIGNESHIIVVKIGDEQKCKTVAKTLLEQYKIAVTPIFYPTVPKGQAIIRLSPTPYHTLQDVQNLANSMLHAFGSG